MIQKKKDINKNDINNKEDKFKIKNKIKYLKKNNKKLKKNIISLKKKNKNKIEKVQIRCRKEIELSYKFSLENIFSSILPILDSLEMATLSLNDNKNIEYYKIYKKLKKLKNYFIKILINNNVKIIDKINVRFNPLFHQAMFLKFSKDIKENNIIDVLQKGYLLHDRLLRAAMVSVSKI
ncbi:nucleotide exchange factor GrpE [Buchnera aphidicola (Periphyllus koelreuteriae)]|uniref:nucleotide exchange factor GrpE n=1 Tax=Buchnera aphidicola TaxID=9 RepID=UPI0031B892E9